jgi:DNA-binding IclR family transcriptional regulator
LLAHFRRMRGAQWRTLGPEIAAAIESVAARAWCAASWQPEVVAVATPLLVQGAHYALNVSVSTGEPFAQTVRELVPTLLALKAGIERELAGRS